MITAFTAGPSARLTQALERSKQTGREPMMYSSGAAVAEHCHQWRAGPVHRSEYEFFSWNEPA